MRRLLLGIFIIVVCSLLIYRSYSISDQTKIATQGMVVSEKMVASQVGADILAQGGNAIDAAVAVGYALAVVDPCCGNIGGGGFITLHLANGKNVFINFREKAPLKASKDMYLDAKGELVENKNTEGFLAVAVPGTVLGLDTALTKYGTMTRTEVMAPAIRLARDGYKITPFDERLFNGALDDFKREPNVAAIFLKNGKPYAVGDLLVQSDLAHTLSLIAEQGPSVFYKGSIAQRIVKASEQHNGILTLADFSQYQIQEMSPIQCQYRGYTILSAPPPSSGGVTLCEMLNILENFPISKYGYRSAENIRIFTEAMRYGFLDRNEQLGDPDFVANPVAKLISKEYARSISDKIKSYSKPPQQKSIPINELTDTTHYSVMDKFGNAVAVTYTLNGFFGAHVIAGDTGFFLNNIMDDFSTQPGKANKFGLVQYDKNNIQPAKRPLSSMTPTIVMKDGKVVMVIGSPGGPRIITAVLLALVNMIDYHMPLQRAINAPRFHYQAQPNAIFTEAFDFNWATAFSLEHLGYSIEEQGTWGAVEAIYKDNEKMYGANDYRRSAGGAAGY